VLPKFQVPKLNPTYVFQAMSEVYDWGMLDLHIPAAHQSTMGEDIKIGIIDSGKSEHYDIQENIQGASNFSTSNIVNDKCGHSTVVSGIIAATKNDEGIVGVAPKAQIYFAKALDDAGAGSTAAMTQSIKWCIEQKVDIISISAGMFFDFKPLHAIIQEAYKQNIILIAAAGNTSNKHYDVAFPAKYPEVIGVAAYDQRRMTAKFSSRGINVFCAMPGVDVYSTWINNEYATMSGTSFSCPYLSGICALILSKHRKNPNSLTPCNTPKQMMEHLEKYSIKLDEHNATGFGTIDLNNLLSGGI
jgi:subtilisin